MSHLIHVLEVKKQLTEAGVLCPQEQSHMLSEAYIRAGLANVYRQGGTLSKEYEAVLWKQLEKWNSVSPINGRFIYSSITNRINLVNGTLATTGHLPCSQKFNTPPTESGLEVDITQMAGFQELVMFLIKELGTGNE